MAAKMLTWCAKQRLLQVRHSVLLQQSASKFWEPDRRGGYDTEIKIPALQRIKVLFCVIRFSL